jgi:hypothetical protein
MIAHIEHTAASLFAVKTKSGVFSCSVRYVRKFLKSHLNWTLRKATRAAQKVPANAQAQCRASFLRQALSIRNHHIPAELRVNIDQAQIVLQDTGNMTYECIGAKQIAVIGKEEKRAFTVLMGVSASGEVLPFQVVWKGKTAASLPSPSSPYWTDAADIGIKFVYSGTDTYWSNHQTMYSYISDILMPYYHRQKTKLNLPDDQEELLQLDVWSVHRSAEFSAHVKATWPTIIRDYVPGGCTGIWQPCDVGMQRLMKVVVRRSQQEDIVQETLAMLKKGVPPKDIKLDDSIKTLRDRSVKWLVEAFRAINDPQIVKKVTGLFINLYSTSTLTQNFTQAFALCRVEDTPFNLSQESLTSPAALCLLRNVRNEEPELWKELDCGLDSSKVEALGTNEQDVANQIAEQADLLDEVDTSVPLDAIKMHIFDKTMSASFAEGAGGCLEYIEDESCMDNGVADKVDLEFIEGSTSTALGSHHTMGGH